MEMLKNSGLILTIWLIILTCIEPYITIATDTNPGLIILKNLMLRFSIPLIILFFVQSFKISRKYLRIAFISISLILFLLVSLYLNNILFYKEIRIFSTNRILNIEFEKINNNIFSLFNKKIYTFELNQIGDDANLLEFVPTNHRKLIIPGGVFKIKYKIMENYNEKTKNYPGTWKPEHTLNDTLVLY